MTAVRELRMKPTIEQWKLMATELRQRYDSDESSLMIQDVEVFESFVKDLETGVYHDIESCLLAKRIGRQAGGR
jgi:hypothetical protein